MITNNDNAGTTNRDQAGPEITVDPVPYTRPEPPAMPTVYVVRYWEWYVSPWPSIPTGWKARTSMFNFETFEEATASANELMIKGMRRVEVVTVHGDKGSAA